MPTIHPTAIVDPECTIDDSASIGPFCVLQGSIRIGPGTKLHERVSMRGSVTIGSNCAFFPGATVGFPPQDFKFDESSVSAGVQIGNGTILRENATVHAATSETTPTRIGENVFMMGNSHAAHDARLDDNVILTNNAMIAGHAHIAEKAIFSGSASVHQFGRIGRIVMVSGGATATADVPPFCIAWGRGYISGLNLVGLRRNGFEREHISMMRKAYSDTFREHLTVAEIATILHARSVDCPPLAEMAAFITSTKRTIAVHMSPSDFDRAALAHAAESSTK